MNKEMNEIIERHGYNLKLEVGNAISKIEAKNIIENAINEAIDYAHSSLQLPYKDDDLLKAYQAGAIEQKDNLPELNYEGLRSLTSDSIEWLKRYKK